MLIFWKIPSLVGVLVGIRGGVVPGGGFGTVSSTGGFAGAGSRGGFGAFSSKGSGGFGENGTKVCFFFTVFMDMGA